MTAMRAPIALIWAALFANTEKPISGLARAWRGVM